jgi:peptide/nickel transport system permease protein
MMAEGRTFFPTAPRIVLLPGIALALTILTVNVLGDALRDRLDAKIAKRMGAWNVSADPALRDFNKRRIA